MGSRLRRPASPDLTDKPPYRPRLAETRVERHWRDSDGAFYRRRSMIRPPPGGTSLQYS